MSEFCVLGADCDQFDRRTNLPGPTGGYVLCEMCIDHSTSDIAKLLYDYIDLSQIIARRDGRSDTKIFRPKPESIPPIDLTVDTLRSDIEQALVLAERELRAASGLPARNTRDARGGYNVDQALIIILPRLEILAGLYFPRPGDAAPFSGAEMLGTLRSLHVRARTVLGRNELKIALPGSCPKCHAMQSLSRRDGSDTVSCGSCEHTMPWSAYQRSVTLVVTQVVAIPASLTRNQPS